jgi:cell division protein FtsA
MLVTREAAGKCTQIDLCPFDDLLEVLDSIDEDPATFFTGGIWKGIDFSKFDMSSVSFADACVLNCVFREGDLLSSNISSTRMFEGNVFIPAISNDENSKHPELNAEQPIDYGELSEASESVRSDNFSLPLALLTNPNTIQRHHLSDEVLEENARMLESVLDDYGVKGEIVSVRPGPVVTMYELEPASGLKASRVIGLADDIALSMSALSVRVSTVPGRTVIGIELPNQNREMVVLREILSHPNFGDGKHKLPLALGKDISGEPIIANLAKMPHLLIAGRTGSGKSVAINTMILSLLYKLKPEDCRMIMIDPKQLELSVYDGIPHLLSPVVTDPKKAVVAIKWVVGEMEERYRKMSKMGVRNIDGYNGRVKDTLAKGEMFSRTFQTGYDDETGEPVFETEEYAPEKMPYIVVIVDEMADLMMVAGKEIEACIQRLAQMARASGIHIIMATQRPSVDVITGTIKANFPTRIAFQVTSKVDSRTILGEAGAEQLLGKGDMLHMAGGAKVTRVHGPFVSDEEVEEVVRHLKTLGPSNYDENVLSGPTAELDAILGITDSDRVDGEEELYAKAVAIVTQERKCSSSYVKRKLGISYNSANRLVERMEEEGFVSQANHVGIREILAPEPSDASGLADMQPPSVEVLTDSAQSGRVQLRRVSYSLAEMKKGMGHVETVGEIAVLDIGSSKISCVILKMSHTDPDFGKVIGHSSIASRGIKFGEIADTKMAAECIKEVIFTAQKTSKTKIKDVAVCFSGGGIRSYAAIGEIQLPSQRVTEQDVTDVIYSSEFSEPADSQEILHAIPVNFSVDQRKGASDPLGLHGNQLVADVHVVMFNQKTLRDLKLCLKICGVKLTTVCSAAYSAGLAVTVDDERKLGVACIDIGHETTSISIFLNDKVVFCETVRMGGRHVTSDLAYGLQCPFETAEQIKLAYAGLDALRKDARVNVKAESGIIVPSHGEVDFFIRPRLEEIFEEAAIRLDSTGFRHLPSRRIVLTGGGSKMQGLAKLANSVLGGQVRVGRPVNLHGLPKASSNFENSAAVGLSLLLVKPQPEAKDFAEPTELDTSRQTDQRPSWIPRWMRRRT